MVTVTGWGVDLSDTLMIITLRTWRWDVKSIAYPYLPMYVVFTYMFTWMVDFHGINVETYTMHGSYGSKMFSMTWLKTCWEFFPGANSYGSSLVMLPWPETIALEWWLGILCFFWWLGGSLVFTLSNFFRCNLVFGLGRPFFGLGGEEEFWEEIMWKTARFV